VSAEAAKRCTGRCGRELPLSAFNRQASNPTGHTPRCRDCQRDDYQDRWGRSTPPAGTDRDSGAWERGFREGVAEAKRRLPILSTAELRELIRLCHPDAHPPERRELATAATAKLNALRERLP
jgi:hypothetical protein